MKTPVSGLLQPATQDRGTWYKKLMEISFEFIYIFFATFRQVTNGQKGCLKLRFSVLFFLSLSLIILLSSDSKWKLSEK